MRGIEKITTREAFQALAPEWNSLLERSAANTIALTHEWLTTWWDVFGKGRELCILLVRDGANLIGIAPLLKRRVSSIGLGVTRLEFLASGEDEADEICSDYLDFIFERGRESDALTGICHYLREVETDWDEWLLTELIETSPTVALLVTQCANHSIKCEVSSIGEAVYLPLEQDWNTLVDRMPRKLRYQIRQDAKAAELGGYTLKIVEDAAGFEDAFQEFIALHESSWLARGSSGVFVSEIFTRFHRELAKKLLLQGRIRFYLLQDENQFHAGLHVFIYDNKAYFYQSGFASTGPVRSPGTLVRNMAIRHAMSSGLREWDFLKAEPNSYKYRWSNHKRQLVQIRVAKPQAKETVRASATFVFNELRKVKLALKR